MESDKPVNPYQSPSVDIICASPESDAEFIDGGRTVPAGNGVNWIGTGWNIFTQSPIAWIVCTVIMLVIFVALVFVPIIGGLFSNILAVIFGGGLMMGCHAQHMGRAFEINDLFGGFKGKARPLITVGLLMIAASSLLAIVAGILFFIFLGTGLIGALASGDSESLSTVLGGSFVGILVIVVLTFLFSVIIAMGFWFAATLVALNNFSARKAIRMSFSACWKNNIPFLLYGLVFLVIFLIATLPFFLGFLVALPLLYTSTYAAYRDIFLPE